MAILRFDARNLNADVLVGTEETFKPSKDLKKFSKDLKKFKSDLNSFLTKNWKTSDVNELNDLFEKNEDALKIWQEYLDKTFAPTVEDLANRVDTINKDICPNYEMLKK